MGNYRYYTWADSEADTMNWESRSSAYERMSDRELVGLFNAAVGAGTDVGLFNTHPTWFLSESRRRGWTAKTCSECGKHAIHENHDYICWDCRHA